MLIKEVFNIYFKKVSYFIKVTNVDRILPAFQAREMLSRHINVLREFFLAQIMINSQMLDFCTNLFKSFYNTFTHSCIFVHKRKQFSKNVLTIFIIYAILTSYKACCYLKRRQNVKKNIYDFTMYAYYR